MAESPDVWFNLGAAYRRLARHAEAVAAYKSALAIDARRVDAWNNLGLSQAADGDVRAAANSYREALDRDLCCTAAWINLGNALRGLGRRGDAEAAYRRALALEPDNAAAMYNMHAAVYRQHAPEQAERLLEEALERAPSHHDARFHLGALRLLHHGDDGGLLDDLPEGCAHLLTSLRFVGRHREARLFTDSFEVLAFALSQARSDGLVMELGVRRGTSIRELARLCPDARVHGFDSFEGLPEAWGEQDAGLYGTGGSLPDVPDNVELHVGWFRDTLPHFVAQRREPLRLLNVDCDLYASTRDALAELAPRVTAGSVLVFDEYLANPDWQHEEHRAFIEAAAQRGWQHRYLAFSLFTKQAVVAIEGA